MKHKPTPRPSQRPLWTCPKCGLNFLTKNLWHSCGQATLEDWRRRMGPRARELYERFERLIARCGEYHVSPAKTRIAFLGRVRFAGITRLSEEGMTCNFALPYPLRSRRFVKVEEVVPGWWSHRLRVTDPRELDPQVQAWLRRSYHLMGMQERLKRKKGSLGRRILAGVFIATLLVSCSSKPASLSEEERALAVRIGFPEAVLLEARRHAVGPITQLNGTDENFDPVPVSGVSLAVPDVKAFKVVNALRSDLAPQGYLAFRYESHFAHEPDKLGILKTTDQFDALRTMKTNGANYDIDTAQVLERLLAWHQRYGLAIYGAGMDFVEATFVKQPADMQAFAKEVYEFCPDVVDQGTETVEALAEEMKRENSLYLWWD